MNCYKLGMKVDKQTVPGQSNNVYLSVLTGWTFAKWLPKLLVLPSRHTKHNSHLGQQAVAQSTLVKQSSGQLGSFYLFSRLYACVCVSTAMSCVCTLLEQNSVSRSCSPCLRSVEDSENMYIIPESNMTEVARYMCTSSLNLGKKLKIDCYGTDRTVKVLQPQIVWPEGPFNTRARYAFLITTDAT